jgi:hypothetical protein
VYPVTSLVHVPPPVTHFSVEVTALITRVQPSVESWKAQIMAAVDLDVPFTPLHVPFKNSDCTPFTTFRAFDVVRISPKIPSNS